MKKIGVIGISGGWSSEKLADEVKNQTGFRLLIEMNKTYYDSEKNSVFYKDIDLLTLDALIVKKISPEYSPEMLERFEMLQFLEDKGLRIFSKPQAVKTCFDRMSGTLKLNFGNIPMPPLVITEDIEKAEEAVQKFGKAIFKPLFSTKARGMIVISSDDKNLKTKIIDFKNNGNQMMYIQKMVNIPGKDLGIAFLGGKYLGTYARVKTTDSWNTTTLHGGKYEPYEPDNEIIELAHKAQSLYGLDFTSVDVVETDNGPFIFEVSAFGGFRGLQDALNIDAAKLYTEYVLNKIS